MKKFMALMLAAAMTVSLAACGSSSSSTTTSSSDETGKGTTAAASTSSAAAADGSFTTVEKGKLHMATNAAFPPYEMTTDDGSYTGIDVEIATKIAEDLGLELVVDDMEFNSVVTSVQQGKEDIGMAGMSVTEERKKNVDFTDSYASAVQSIIVKDDSSIQSADDLANATMIGVQTGTTGDIDCQEQYGTDHVSGYSNGALAVQALLADKVDAVVIDNNPAKEFVAQNSGLKILDTPYEQEDYAIAVSKDNTALREAINAELNKLISDGTVQEIVSRYMNAEALGTEAAATEAAATTEAAAQ